MSTPINNLFVISDLYTIAPSDKKSYENKWPKKNLTINPTSLYSSWVDRIAEVMDSYVYYIYDKDLSMGGALKIATEVIKQNRDSSDSKEVINFFVIDLTGLKSNLRLASLTPEEIEKLHKASFNLHKSKDLSKVSKSLEIINNYKNNDIELVFQRIEVLQNTINESANYNNRFLITCSGYFELAQLLNFYKNNNPKKPITEIGELFLKGEFNPKLADKRLSASLLNKIKKNDYVYILEYDFSVVSNRIRLKAKAQTHDYSAKQKEIYRNKYIPSNLSDKPKISFEDHKEIGEKLITDLTKTTKLFTI